MPNKNTQIKLRVRPIIIQNKKLLTHYTSQNDYYYYPGGHVEFGETIKEAAVREIEEECGQGTNFKFNKILYVREFIIPKKEHSFELFILGDISKCGNLEKKVDSQSDGKIWLSWLDIENLPDNLYPDKLTPRLLKDYKKGFPNHGEYIGKI